MLRSADNLTGYPILAKDGEIGRIHDFLFDDSSWTVRYMVVDTGTWLPGRKVLVSPRALAEVNWKDQHAHLDLTKDEIEQSPDIEEDRPVSRQNQLDLYRYYGWAPYWTITGMGTLPAAVTVPPDEKAKEEVAKNTEGDPHLRSVREVENYRIEATDGEIGHVDDFIVEDDSWTIRYMVVDTKNWLPGRKVLVAPPWIADINWVKRQVAVQMPREEVKHSPEYDPSAPVNRQYEVRLFDYYGRPKYW